MSLYNILSAAALMSIIFPAVANAVDIPACNQATVQIPNRDFIRFSTAAGALHDPITIQQGAAEDKLKVIVLPEGESYCDFRNPQNADIPFCDSQGMPEQGVEGMAVEDIENNQMCE